jgi:hypothetical protein
MATNHSVPSATAFNVSFNLISVLSLPWLDRTIVTIGLPDLISTSRWER